MESNLLMAWIYPELPVTVDFPLWFRPCSKKMFLACLLTVTGQFAQTQAMANQVIVGIAPTGSSLLTRLASDWKDQEFSPTGVNMVCPSFFSS